MSEKVVRGEGLSGSSFTVDHNTDIGAVVARALSLLDELLHTRDLLALVRSIVQQVLKLLADLVCGLLRSHCCLMIGR